MSPLVTLHQFSAIVVVGAVKAVLIGFARSHLGAPLVCAHVEHRAFALATQTLRSLKHRTTVRGVITGKLIRRLVEVVVARPSVAKPRSTKLLSQDARPEYGSKQKINENGAVLVVEGKGHDGKTGVVKRSTLVRVMTRL